MIEYYASDPFSTPYTNANSTANLISNGLCYIQQNNGEWRPFELNAWNIYDERYFTREYSNKWVFNIANITTEEPEAGLTEEIMEEVL